MSRYSSSGSTGHGIQRFGPDEFRISWVVDFYYRGSRLRWPRQFTRDTDRAGALRFSRRWGVPMPEEPR